MSPFSNTSTQVQSMPITSRSSSSSSSSSISSPADPKKDSPESINSPGSTFSPTLDQDSDLESQIFSSSSSCPNSGLAEKEHVEAAGAAATTGLSLTKTTTNATSVIPRSRRRGFLGQWGLVPEVEDPYEYRRHVKHLITIIVGLGSAAAPFGSSIVFPALSDIQNTFNSTPTVTNLTVALYMAAMGLAPLYWSMLSETHGRRTVYLISFLLFIASGVGGALADGNIAVLIIMRMGSGASAGAVQSVGVGSIADIWEVKERGQAMGWFYLGPLMGPLIAPIIGGILTQKLGWRSTQWFLVGFGVLVWILVLLGLPETLRKKDSSGHVILEKLNTRGDVIEDQDEREKADLRRQRSIFRKIWDGFIDPLRSFTYLRYPPVALTIWYASIAFASLYFLNVSMQSTFNSPPYNFTSSTIGLIYIAPSLGYFVGSVIGGRWTDTIMKRRALSRHRKLPDLFPTDNQFLPEDRMGENTIIGGLLFPCSLIIYGWTSGLNPSGLWPIPIVATSIFGFGSMLIFSMSTTMLTEFVPQKASAAVAVQNLIRNLFACIGSIVAEPVISGMSGGIEGGANDGRGLGGGPAFTLIGGIGLLSLGVVWVMRKWGPGWRERIGEFDLT